MLGWKYGRAFASLSLSLSLAFFSATANAAEVELRLAAGFAQNEILARPIGRLADLIKEKSKGEIEAKVFYQSLGTEQQLAQSVMSGTVDIGELANGNSSRFTNAFLIYDLPFLFKKYDNLLKSLDTASGKKVVSQFEKDSASSIFLPSATPLAAMFRPARNL